MHIFDHTFTLVEIVILIAVTIGAVTDMVTKKIYNVVTFPTMAIGLVLNSMQNFSGAGFSLGNLGWSFAGLLLGLGITILPRLKKGSDAPMAYGDVKMWMAIGACLMPAKMLISWFYFSITFGTISAILVLKAIPKDQIKGFWLMLKTFFTAGVDLSGTVDTTDVDAARKKLIPICPAIAIGTLCGILFDRQLMHFMGFNWY
ncbi:MAG: prepilin peptidase [Cyanobacteria bacterium SZAS LIN-2]|nr:prepilin peptidase [Cyanobacteria bacterium SZAS LIN-2]